MDVSIEYGDHDKEMDIHFPVERSGPFQVNLEEDNPEHGTS